MSQPNRTHAGGRIDRRRPLRFQCDGRRYEGYAGDTLASALLANDVHLVGRSFKYHRPRGILALGAEEPNALVQLEEGAYTEPNVRATQVELYDGLVAHSQNRWPSLEFDLGALNDALSPLLPAGFYYKTFMWPASLWMRYEQGIRRMAGLGRAPQLPDPDRYDRMHAHCDVLIVGAGPAGLAAALTAARAGARVILADEQPEAGGQLLWERYDIDGRPAMAWVANIMAELLAAPEVCLLPRTLVSGYYDHNFLVACQRFESPRSSVRTPRQRLWKIRAREVVLATGAIERTLVFPDNDRPGIMLAGAVRGYLNRYGVKAGTRVLVATVGDDGYRTALDLASAGVAIVAVVDMRSQAAGFLPQQARARGIEVLTGQRIVSAEGRMRVSAVHVQPFAGGAVREIACDLVAMSGGWIPAVHLFSQARGRLRVDPRAHAFVPGEAAQAVRCAGSMQAAWSLHEALAQGFSAGTLAARACGFDDARALEIPQVSEPETAAAEVQHAHRGERASRRKQFVDFQSDVTIADVTLAAREGYDAIEHLKRYTTAGMGVDQGKTGNANVIALLADARSESIGAIGTTTFRPPYQPVSFGAIAGMDAGELFEPLRKTPMHEWHERRGALFEDVGQWKRAWYYPRADEDMHAAVQRECVAVRRGVGMLDAATLGKIDVQGPDAAEFLDRIYCNPVRSLAPGRCRYGLMLGQDGMVFDDGVIARLAEQHFVLTTTTGGAARVAAWLEEWLQTEWPSLRAYCTPVTEQYAQIALSGPHSADVLAPLCNVDIRAMPFMAVRTGEVAGIAARVFRLSFAGGLGYEIAVPAGRGYELWTTLMGAGERFGIAPYGTEAMHVLRAEKGFIIVGQETDGAVTPIDLGLDRLVASDKSFIGKRSLTRPDARRTDRRQLVGLLTEKADQVLPEGTQLVAEPRALLPIPKEPVPMIGYVTSSYFSPTCARSIALALVEAGIARIGETLYAPLASGYAKVTLTAPRFVGDSGEALHG
jgi:sarcosine oxidase, subunit alpha